MSILNSASSRTVYRGYEHLKNENVISYTQLSDFEYEKLKSTPRFDYYIDKMIQDQYIRKNLSVFR